MFALYMFGGEVIHDFASGVSGFALEAALYLPPQTWGYWMLLGHVTVAMEMMLLLPFTKFAHVIYRTVALYLGALKPLLSATIVPWAWLTLASAWWVIPMTLLPAAARAYVGGSSEVAYFAQIQVLYELYGRPMPAIWPRNSYTLIEPEAAKRDIRIVRGVLGLTGLAHVAADQLEARPVLLFQPLAIFDRSAAREVIERDSVLAALDKMLSIEREIKRGHLMLLVRIKDTLTPEQQASISRILKDIQSEIQAARKSGGPEEAKAKSKELRSATRVKIRSVLTEEQRKQYDSMDQRPDNSQAPPQMYKVWVPIPEGKPVPVDITTGISDGSYTEVTSGALKEGQEAERFLQRRVDPVAQQRRQHEDAPQSVDYGGDGGQQLHQKGDGRS